MMPGDSTHQIDRKLIEVASKRAGDSNQNQFDRGEHVEEIRADAGTDLPAMSR